MTEPPASGVPAPNTTVEDIYRGATGGDTWIATVYGFVDGAIEARLSMQGNPYCDFSLRGKTRAVPVRLAPAKFAEYKSAIAFHNPETGTEHMPLIAVTGVVQSYTRSVLPHGEVAYLNAERVQRLPLPEGFRYGDNMNDVLDEILDPHMGRLSVGIVPPEAFGQLVEIYDEWVHEHCDTESGCPGNTSKHSAAELRDALHTVREYLEGPEPEDPYRNAGDREGALRWIRGVLEGDPGRASRAAQGAQG